MDSGKNIISTSSIEMNRADLIRKLLTDLSNEEMQNLVNIR